MGEDESDMWILPGPDFHDAADCKVLGRVPFSRYARRTWQTEQHAAAAYIRDHFMGMPLGRELHYGNMIKEMRVAAGRPVPVVFSYSSSKNFPQGSPWYDITECKAEAVFVPVAGQDYTVSNHTDQSGCTASIYRIDMGADGKHRLKAQESLPGGCLKASRCKPRTTCGYTVKRF